jgi:RecA-family ATPase
MSDPSPVRVIHDLRDEIAAPLPTSPGTGKEWREDVPLRASDLPEPLPVTWLWGQRIPEEDGCASNVIGSGGANKSLSCHGLAAAVALGEPFLGEATKQRDVLLIESEGMRKQALRNLYRIARGAGRTAPPDNVFLLGISGPLRDDQVFDRCRRGIDQVKPGLIILDSVAAASYTSDSNAAGEMVEFYKRLRDFGVPCLAIDHISKAAASSNGKSGTASGSVQKFNQARSVMELTQAKGGGLHLSHEKSNFGPRQAPITFAVQFTVDTITFELIGETDDRMEGLEGLRPTEDRLIDELAEYGDGGTKVKPLAEALGVTQKTISNTLSRLKGKGKVAQVGAGAWRVV